jgi:hypothetical protein
MLTFIKKPNNCLIKSASIILFILLEWILLYFTMFIIFKPVESIISNNKKNINIFERYNYISLTLFFVYSIIILYYKVIATISLYDYIINMSIFRQKIYYDKL